MDQALKNEFQKLNQRFDKLYSFIEKNVALKSDLHEMQKANDQLVGEVIVYRTEQAVTDHRLKKIEGWITKAAPQVGVAFQQ